MRKPPPLFLRVMHAAVESNLPKDVKLLVFVMALSANSRTGIGWASQGTIAARMSSSDRHVRALLGELERHPNPPVRVVRRRRGAPGGKGRSSDVYQLVLGLAQPERRSASDNPPQPEQRAGSGDSDGASSTGTPRHLNRNATTPQPERCSDDLRSDRRSDRRSNTSDPVLRLVPPTERKQAARRRRSTPKPPASAHKRVTDHYFAEFERVRGEKPIFDGAEGTAVKKLLKGCKGDAEQACRIISNAFAGWKRKTVEIRAIANKPAEFQGGDGAGNVQRGMGHYEQGDQSWVEAE